MKTRCIFLFLLLALLLTQPLYAEGESAAMPVISVQPQDQSIKLGESCTLSVSAAVGDGGSLSYMWCSSATGDMSGMTAIGGGSETGSSLTVSAAAAGTTYYCVMVTNTLGGNVTSLYSRIACVTVSENTQETITGIEVAALPARLQYTVGSTLDSTGLVLRLLTDSGSREVTTDFTCYPTALTQVGTQTITVSYGVYSSTFTVEVAADHAEAPVINSQPADQSLELGEKAALSVTASVNDGGILSYRWYTGRSADFNSMSPCPAPAALLAQYTALDLPIGDTYFCVRITNTLGQKTAETTSRAALVRVVPGKPVITEQPTAQRVKVDDRCTLSVAATSPGSTVSYLWYSGSSSDLSSMTAMDRGTRTGSTLTVDTTTPGTRYYCALVMSTASGVTSSVYTRVAAVQVEEVVVASPVTKPSNTPMPTAVPIPEGAQEEDKEPEPTADAPDIPGVTPTPSPETQPAKRSHTGTWIAVIAAVVAIGAGGAYWYLGRREEDDE